MSGHMEVWLCVQYPASHTRCVCEGWAGPLIKALHITGWRTLMPQAGSQIHPSVGRDLLTWVLSTLYSIYSLHDSYWHWTTTYVYTVFQCPSLHFNASNSFSGRDARFCVHSDNLSIILPHLLNVWLEYTGARSESHGGHFQTISRSQREIFFFCDRRKSLSTPDCHYVFNVKLAALLETLCAHSVDVWKRWWVFENHGLVYMCVMINTVQDVIFECF